MCFKAPKTLLKALENVAKAHGVSKSEIVRRAVLEYLEREARNAGVLKALAGEVLVDE